MVLKCSTCPCSLPARETDRETFEEEEGRRERERKEEGGERAGEKVLKGKYTFFLWPDR